MSFTDGLSRLRDALGITQKNKIRIVGDFLTKVNLPSVMGRRDAAYDAAYNLAQIDIFSQSEAVQSNICLNMMGILDLAIQDTNAIINILSSPDTVSREEQYLFLQQNIRNFLGIWARMIKAKEYMQSSTNTKGLDPLIREENMLENFEISLVNRIKFIFQDNAKRVHRYRGYMTKSFSKPYAERYNKSFAEYSKSLPEYCEKI
ncbi:MAG: hypothetical protein IKA22_04235 [Lentisphaeria bacterium]|nr:hypothetical protein [Lentisphaeria bacterium]